jgi:ribulose-phosphate 3-epimerase
MLKARGLAAVEIEVDGGVHGKTIAACVEVGATIAVAGSAVFNAKASVADNLAALRRAAGVRGGRARGAAG